MPDIQLTGITWDRTRGDLPTVATAQRFGESHPGVTIEWRNRSFNAFGDQPLAELAPHFDLLVIDHPFVGLAHARGLLLPLDERLPAAFLANQAANSVGASYPSYVYGGHLWVLPIDAATPVSAWRPDLLELAGQCPPETWDYLLALALSGMVWLNGDAGQPPLPFGLAVADMFAGAHLAHGILACLVRRGVTGRGGLVEVSLLESALDFQFELLTTHLNDGGMLPERSAVNNAHAYLGAPYGIYATADGYLARHRAHSQRQVAIDGALLTAAQGAPKIGEHNDLIAREFGLA
jgi:hypothetical protein